MKHAPLPLDAAKPLQLPAICAKLASSGHLTVQAAKCAMAQACQYKTPIQQVLHNEFSISEQVLSRMEAETSDMQLIDPIQFRPDQRLVSMFGAEACLERGVLPWRAIGARTIVLVDNPAQAERHMDALNSTFGSVCFALTSRTHLEAAIQADFDEHLAFRAETVLSSEQSCRDWNIQLAHFILLLVAGTLLAGLSIAPILTVALLYGWVVLVLICSTVLKLGAVFCSKPETPLETHNINVKLPTITLLVPLYKEREITSHLVENLKKLDYPKGLLDVCLVVESDDLLTQSALAQLSLPAWMRTLTVPAGKLRTKPRAMNYAMRFSHGSIIGVYDAEDAPDALQLRTVAQMFENSDPTVACVQGSLDYFNADSNWLARCFSLEYASWFRVVLPGYARMGLVVPLGGTSLFFRRDVLDDLGAWDAHNVTEDADLGLRLARAGYRTVFMPSVTLEEANARLWPWIKQRSRWLKGYAVTYAVHMRNPWKLVTDLGAWRFFGVQILFLGTLSQFLLAPLLWSIMIVPFGLPHPAMTFLNETGFWILTGLFLFSALVNLWANSLGAVRAGKPWLIKWALTTVFYFPLGTLGALKGLTELFWKPFYWDKTAHGIDVRPQRSASTASASNLKRIS